MVWWVPLAAAAGKVAGDLIGNKSQQKFNAKEAQKQRDFEERMSNTGYQIVQNLTNMAKSAAKEFDDSAIKKQMDEVIDTVVGRARNVPRNREGIEKGSLRERADKWFRSRKH